MDDKKLSGIERELVLQYLIDGNVPVTITPLENQYEADVLLQYGPLEEIFLSPEIPQWIKYLYMESKMTDECDRYDVLFEAADALTDVLYMTLED